MAHQVRQASEHLRYSRLQSGSMFIYLRGDTFPIVTITDLSPRSFAQSPPTACSVIPQLQSHSKAELVPGMWV